jgi:hypothetical protein
MKNRDKLLTICAHLCDKNKCGQRRTYCAECALPFIKWGEQLLPALKVNIIIVHPRGVVFPEGFSFNSGMQKRIHFRTDMEHNICRPVNNSDVSVKNTNMKFMKTQDKNTQISVYCIQHYCK